ncbi:MAG: hypothetical protein EON93_07830 [Burkholderiales bacterium]|nr:MAG: hypothetical protein EON93_07830 [Burkholderiales bacterium]
MSLLMRSSADDHRARLAAIVASHFSAAEGRIEQVYLKHFAPMGAVLDRHWRHKRDIPMDLATLPRDAWRVAKGLVARKGATQREEERDPKLSGKQKEVVDVLGKELLDLPSLDQKLSTYVAQYQQEFDSSLHELLSELKPGQREDVQKQLLEHVERMSLPVEGAREALMFGLVTLIGHGIGTAGFGSAVGVGQAAAGIWYASSLPWWGALWVHVAGVPAWVGVAGGAGGVVAALLVAPLLAPFIELLLNRWRARTILKDAVDTARGRLEAPPSDQVDMLGRIAVYLQILPDLLYFVGKASKAYRS